MHRGVRPVSIRTIFDASHLARQTAIRTVVEHGWAPVIFISLRITSVYACLIYTDTGKYNRVPIVLETYLIRALNANRLQGDVA